MLLSQVNEAAAIIYDLVDPNANLIFGTVVDPSLGDAVSITIIATGFAGSSEPEFGALKATPTTAPRAVHAAPPMNQAPARMQAAPPATNEAPTNKSAGGIEIPDFLRRRRLQGK